MEFTHWSIEQETTPKPLKMKIVHLVIKSTENLLTVTEYQPYGNEQLEKCWQNVLHAYMNRNIY